MVSLLVLGQFLDLLTPGHPIGGQVVRHGALYLLPSGRALPSAHTLAQEHEIAVGSVKRAIEILRAEGHARAVLSGGHLQLEGCGNTRRQRR